MFERLEGDKERITLNDSLIESIMKLMDGNPGAMSVCTMLIKEYSTIDPQSALGPLSGVLSLDTHGIYGSNIWIFYKDICGESITDVIVVMRAIQLGHLAPSDLFKAIRNCDSFVLNLDNLRTTVTTELSDFVLESQA
jgi:hypothetical protein